MASIDPCPIGMARNEPFDTIMVTGAAPAAAAEEFVVLTPFESVPFKGALSAAEVLPRGGGLGRRQLAGHLPATAMSVAAMFGRG